VRGLFLALALTLAGCSRGGCKREIEAGPPARDDVITALVHFREPIAAGQAKSLAPLIEQVSATQDAAFAKTGDVYVHHVAPEPDWPCIADRTCFSNYLRFLADAERSEFPPPDVSQKASVLEKELSIAALEAEMNLRVEYVERELPSAQGIAYRGDPKAGRTVYLLSTGHAIEAKRDAALAKILAAHSTGLRIGELKRESAPALFEALGHRLTAVAMIDGHLRKDVVSYEQWLELLYPNEAFPAPVHRHSLSVVDAHEHLLGGGAPRLIDIERAEGATGAIVAALPTPQSFDGPNEIVLSAARKDPPFLLPLATLDELSPSAPATMKVLISRGARGLKLLTGHDDFHRARGSPPLDPDPLRKVLDDLEAQDLPVLWHVNTHLFVDGFLASLKAHPREKFVIPHFAGYLTYAPNIVRRLLVENPNLSIDISLGTQPRYLRRGIEDLSARSEEWRKLFIEMPDRFLFGLDMVVTPETSRAHGRMLMSLYRSVLEDDEFDLDFFPARGWSLLSEESHHHAHMKGLALPREVLEKIYSSNASRIYGGPR
jgi:predicted TIM-barrel fold metal-dependent hydrolase